MPFNGSGVFSIVNTFVPGTTIFSSAVNANYSDIATGLSTAILKDGTQTVTADIPMSGHKFTNLGAGSAAADSVRYDQLALIPNFPGFSNIARRNGGLGIWQRGAGGAASIAVGASTTAYTADGWYLVTGANQASVVSQQAGIATSSQWCARVQRNSGQTGTTAMSFGFPIDTDELYAMLGQFVRVSMTLKAGANWSPSGGSITLALNVGTGTPVKFSAGYTGAAIPASLTQAITSSAVRYEFGSAAIVPTTTRQAEITLTWTPVGTAGVNDYVEIDDVQLEVVTDATQVAGPFERLNFLEQWSLCQRHFQKSFLYSVAPAQNAGFVGSITFMAGKAGAGSDFFSWNFPFVMRGTPAITYFNTSATNAQARDSVAGADCSSTAASNIAAGSFFTLTTGNASTAVGNSLEVHFTADAGI